MSHIVQILPDVTNHGQTNIEYYFMSIRDRLKWISTMGHERVLLLKRRYDGQRCPFYSEVRHSSQQHGFDTFCYGIGWINSNVDLTKIPGFDPNNATSVVLPDGLGGFFHSIEITASFMQGGPLNINAKESGWQRDYHPVSWCLWEPVLAPGDIFVRKNGARYLVTSVDPRRWRSYITHQTFTTVELERNHPIYFLPLGL